MAYLPICSSLPSGVSAFDCSHCWKRAGASGGRWRGLASLHALVCARASEGNCSRCASNQSCWTGVIWFTDGPAVVTSTYMQCVRCVRTKARLTLLRLYTCCLIPTHAVWVSRLQSKEKLAINALTLYGSHGKPWPECSRCSVEKCPSAPAFWLSYWQLQEKIQRKLRGRFVY